MLQSTKLLKYNTAVYYYSLHCNAPSPTPYPLHYWAGCFHLTTWPSDFHHGCWMAPHPSNILPHREFLEFSSQSTPPTKVTSISCHFIPIYLTFTDQQIYGLQRKMMFFEMEPIGSPLGSLLEVPLVLKTSYICKLNMGSQSNLHCNKAQR